MSIIPTTIKSKELVEKRREQIVLTAIKLFAQKGFHETNLRELAEETGISHGNIYDYVGTKQDIFFLIHEFINNIAIEKINRSTENIKDPLEKLRRMVRTEFELMHEWSDAILLLYQETHILDKPLLKLLLKRERARVSKFEQTIEQCIKKGQFRDCNIRVAANLVKSMTETWVAKRWDLRGHVDRAEMEKAIIDLISNGLLKEKGSATYTSESKEFEGKSALVINAGTLLGKAISFSLLSKGAKLAIHADNGLLEEREYPTPESKKWKEIRNYCSKDYGPLTVKLFKQIVNDFGPIDIIIQDLGISTKEIGTTWRKKISVGQSLKQNIDCAQELAISIEEEMSKVELGQLLYLAPWVWDQYDDPIGYQTTKAAISALTKTMAKRLAGSSVNVNCVVPGFIGGIRPLEIENEMSSEVINHVPMGRVGEISDLLEAVYFLISDRSKYITGQELKINGGME